MIVKKTHHYNIYCTDTIPFDIILLINDIVVDGLFLLYIIIAFFWIYWAVAWQHLKKSSGPWSRRRTKINKTGQDDHRGEAAANDNDNLDSPDFVTVFIIFFFFISHFKVCWSLIICTIWTRPFGFTIISYFISQSYYAFLIPTFNIYPLLYLLIVPCG